VGGGCEKTIDVQKLSRAKEKKERKKKKAIDRGDKKKKRKKRSCPAGAEHKKPWGTNLIRGDLPPVGNFR